MSEPYQPQLLWGRDPVPDTRSTDLLSVEGGRVVLHLEESETHTGLTEASQWRSIASKRIPCGAQAQGPCVDFLAEWHRQERRHLDGWPTDTQAIRDAAARLNLALDHRDAGVGYAEDGDRERLGYAGADPTPRPPSWLLDSITKV